jgi:uncharacterized protein
VLLGHLAGTPVYIDAAQDERWRRPNLTIDVSPGAAMGFSLEGSDELHFVTLTARSVAGTTAPKQEHQA